MAKLSQQPRKPKRSHYKSANDYERALWTYSCESKNIGPWMNYLKTGKNRPTAKEKRKQRRHDALVYGMLTHGGYGKVAAYQ